MAKDYECPACSRAVDLAATVCSNPTCRVDLAFCSSCRDVTTYLLTEPASGRFKRDRYKCGRCQQIGVKCATWLSGGYCNGLAKTGGAYDQPFCANCTNRVGEVGRSVLSWSIIGALGGLLKRPKK